VTIVGLSAARRSFDRCLRYIADPESCPNKPLSGSCLCCIAWYHSSRCLRGTDVLHTRSASCNQPSVRTVAERPGINSKKSKMGLWQGSYRAKFRFFGSMGPSAVPPPRTPLSPSASEAIIIFSKRGVAEILNLQPRGSLAKPYQVKQVRSVIIRYKLAEGAE